ncbi:MAG TPA: OmpA family protein [Flavisolibacter sp.]|nr:OmpA family protein [Flavisolibacter sp.]
MRLIPFILLLVALRAPAQNLLVNGDFEEENICAEYNVNCSPEAWVYTVPSFVYYFKDSSLSHNGKHFVALIAGHTTKPYYRTFVRSRLLCQLQKGKIYRFQCYTKSDHQILDSFGVYFSSYDFLFEKQPYEKIRPSIYFANGIKNTTGDTGWQKVVIDYKARGDEVFIALGNFSKADITGPTGIPMENSFFVLFDEVSLIPTDPKEILCRDWLKAKEAIYAQDERHEYQAQNMLKYKTASPPTVPAPSSTIVLKVDTFLIPEIFFATNSFTVTKQALSLLDSFSKEVNTSTTDSIIVNGHTDSRGTDATNKELSWRRANTVAAYLQNRLQVPIVSRGFGSGRPVADNRTTEGRQRNRRVEILLYKQ